MAEMKLYELVNHYHIGTELTCAEAVFMACNVLRRFYRGGRDHRSDDCKRRSDGCGQHGRLPNDFRIDGLMLGFYGTLHCVELQRLEIVGYENPCHAIVEALAKKLEAAGGPQDLPPGKRRTTGLLMCGKARDYMKDFSQYGNRPDDQWEMLPWIPDPRPPFKIWVKPEQIAPFFLIPHHPYAISLLLKISDGFRAEEFRRLGLTGSSEDWERLVRGVIREFEKNNSARDLFHFDSDEDVFCVYSQYIDDLMMLAKLIRAACADEKTMGMYLNMSEAAKT